MNEIKRFFSLDGGLLRSEAPIEWWYFHGSLKEESNISFMLCVFCNTMKLDEDSSKDGFTAFFSILNPEKSIYRFASWVDPDFFSYFINHKEVAFRTGINGLLLDDIFNEYQLNGPPQPVTINHSPILFRVEPFEFQWDTIRIAVKENSVLLEFADPEEGSFYNLKINPGSPYLEVQSGIDLPSSKGMAYLSHPAGFLEKTGGNHKVTGSAWMDHQWGDYAWFLNDHKNPSILGWNWLGINLGNGAELIVSVHMEMPDLKPIGTYALLRDQDGKIMETRKVEIIPQRYWLSPGTGIQYPVEMKVRLPDFEAELDFIPDADNQEIPVFGLQRAVWQGAGQISGNIGDKPVQGIARGELNGYGYLFSLDDYLIHQSEKIDPVIESFFPRIINEKTLESYAGRAEGEYFPSAVSEFLSQPVWDLLSRKGKRWRPVFTRLLMRALGMDSEPYEVMLYCLAELVHTGSLIIDDIEDDSLLRRGEEAIHIRYGQDLAINAANTLYFLPVTLLFDHPLLDERQKLEIYQVMTRQYIGAHLGQGQDLFFTRNMNKHNLDIWLNDSLEPKLFQMYSLKTGAPLKGLAETVSIIARSSKECRKACGDFASAFGVTFQIIDDINNFSNSPNWTKTCGEDLVEGKMTYVIFQCLKNVHERDRERLMKILTSKELRKNPEAIQEGVKIIRESGSLDFCRQKARTIMRPAWDNVSQYLKPNEQRLLLKLLTTHLVEIRLDPGGADRDQK